MDVSSTPITVVLADDHPLVRAGFSSALKTFGIQVVAEVELAEDVFAVYDRLTPDVLVLDVRFGDAMTGLDVAVRLLDKHPNANIVFLSQFTQDAIVQRAYQVGGKCFLSKDSEIEELAAAIQKASSGELYFTPKVAQRLASLSVTGEKSPAALLSARELAIFGYMARGLTNAEIAAQMNLSIKTISNSSQDIKERLGFHRQSDLTRIAIRHGILEP